MWDISRKLEHPCLYRGARKTRSVPAGEVRESLQQRRSWKQGTWPLLASDRSRDDPGDQAPRPHSFARSLQQVPPVGWVQAEGRGQGSPNGIVRAEPSRHSGGWSGYTVDSEGDMVMELLCPAIWCKDFFAYLPLHICIFTHLHIQYRVSDPCLADFLFPLCCWGNLLRLWTQMTSERDSTFRETFLCYRKCEGSGLTENVIPCLSHTLTTWLGETS